METNVASERLFNFSAGPAVMPVPVLEQIRDEIVCMAGVGSSVMEISHRGKKFTEILQSTQENLRQLLNIPDNYKVLFLQGGALLQFSMIPRNLLRGNSATADYLVTGSWSKKAVVEAKREGNVNVVWDGADSNYNCLPAQDGLQLSADSSYLYYTSNETIQGVQFPQEPQSGDAPLVCDASSDFLCRPLDIEKYGLIYACAQKNAGPAGVTVVVIRDDLLERSSNDLPSYLNYRLHAEADSCLNTPPSFAVYAVGLVTKWLLDDIGGLDQMFDINQRKAQLLYDVIDQSDNFYSVHSVPESRSIMNVAFKLPTEDLEKHFLDRAAENGLVALKGHRSVGGIRASIYNAMPEEGVRTLAEFMRDFAAKNAG